MQCKRLRKQMSMKFTSLNRYLSSVIVVVIVVVSLCCFVVALSLTVSFVWLKSKRYSATTLGIVLSQVPNKNWMRVCVCAVSLCVLLLPCLCVMFSLLFCKVLLFNFLHIKQFGKKFCTRLKTCARILHKYLHNQPECHNKHSSRVDLSLSYCCYCCCSAIALLFIQYGVWILPAAECRLRGFQFAWANIK